MKRFTVPNCPFFFPIFEGNKIKLEKMLINEQYNIILNYKQMIQLEILIKTYFRKSLIKNKTYKIDNNLRLLIVEKTIQINELTLNRSEIGLLYYLIQAIKEYLKMHRILPMF